MKDKLTQLIERWESEAREQRLTAADMSKTHAQREYAHGRAHAIEACVQDLRVALLRSV